VSHKLRKTDDFQAGDFTMFIKIPIALAMILSTSADLVAADNQRPGVPNDRNNEVLINRCVPDYKDPLCGRAGWIKD
jgi:hypothetical protein